MSVKHYVSLFVTEDMYNTIEDTCKMNDTSKSKIGREALGMYLGLKSDSLAWLKKQAMCTGRPVSGVLDEMISNSMR